jgi:hypothetical protein
MTGVLVTFTRDELAVPVPLPSWLFHRMLFWIRRVAVKFVVDRTSLGLSTIAAEGDARQG